MIYSLEGPDRAGKSTLFAALSEVLVDMVHVSAAGIPPALYPHMSEVERFQEHLWSCHYNPELDYLCDRSFTVTAQVYSRLHGRELLIDPAKWVHHQYVFALLPPVEELQARTRELHSLQLTQLSAALAAYRSVLQHYSWTPVPWDLTVDEQVDWVVAHLEKL